MDRRSGQHGPLLGSPRGPAAATVRVLLADLLARLLPIRGLAGRRHGQERRGGDAHVQDDGEVPAAAARLVCPLPEVRHLRQVVHLHRQGRQAERLAESPRLPGLSHQGGLVRAQLRRLVRRQVYRHRLRRQKSHPLRGHILKRTFFFVPEKHKKIGNWKKNQKIFFFRKEKKNKKIGFPETEKTDYFFRTEKKTDFRKLGKKQIIFSGRRKKTNFRNCIVISATESVADLGENSHFFKFVSPDLAAENLTLSAALLFFPIISEFLSHQRDIIWRTGNRSLGLFSSCCCWLSGGKTLSLSPELNLAYFYQVTLHGTQCARHISFTTHTIF